jgi:diphthamide biosynthesis methyltransferase
MLMRGDAACLTDWCPKCRLLGKSPHSLTLTLLTFTSLHHPALPVCGPDALAIGVARVGQSDQKIIAGTLSELLKVDFGAPLHSLILVGNMHELERAVFDR